MAKKKSKVKLKDNPFKHKKRLIIAAFSMCGVLKQALELAKISRTQHLKWMDTDPGYAADIELAREDAIDSLELEAIRRAKEGTKKLVFYKGKPVMVPKDLNNPKSPKEIYVENEYSDSLLMFLLKGQRPEKYRENANKIDVQGNLQIKTLDGVSIEDL